MMSLLSFHAAAAARGDGLHAELLAALARNTVSPNSGVTTRSDGMIQSGPDPASALVASKSAELVPSRGRNAFEKWRHEAHCSHRIGPVGGDVEPGTDIV
jgi:hypothetical protein